MSAPFNVDLASQQAQTEHFRSDVETTMATNNQMKGIAESAMTANQGQMSQAFQSWMEDIVQHATTNNQVLSGVVDALSFGIKSTTSQEESNAASLAGLTGTLGSSFSSGSHFS